MDQLILTNFIQSINNTEPSNFVFVNQKSDLPTPNLGVITLEDNYTYYFTTTVDLLGDRIVAGQNTTILGSSSENCRIKSTGLVGTALLTSQYSLPMRGITIEAVIALDLDALGNPTAAIDWFGVNFTDCAEVGRIANYSNFIMTDSAFLNSGKLTFDGTIGTVGFNQCFFDAAAGATLLELPSTLTLTRRFRIIYSSFVILPGETGIDVNALATIPVESYILDTINFSGGGTYIAGVQFIDNKASFVNCKGIGNSAAICNYYMQDNVTLTDIVTQGVAVKMAGTTTANAITQKFTHTNNRATYVGAIPRTFKITAVTTIEAAGVGKKIGLYFAKNEFILADSEIYATTSGNNRAENISIQTITDLSENDFIEVWVENATDTTDVTGTFLNIIITTIN